LVLRDGSAAADLVIDIDQETVSLMQGDQVLGEYQLRDVQYLRWDHGRVVLTLGGENADFYPYRPDDFVATLHETLETDHRR
jgi:hypothetical protein